MDDLIAAIADVRDRLRRDLYQNERQVSEGVVTPVLKALGWAVGDPTQVSPDFKIGNGWVDYALLRDPFGAVILMEVKDVGKASTNAEEQLFRYCLQQGGVPLAVLTDGRTWRFYWPAGSGNFEQRRFAVTDLVDDEAPDCARMLGRYLEFSTVSTGRFEEYARNDYTSHRNRIMAKQEFGRVADSLVTQADERLVALFSAEVEKRCGIRPDGADVRGFLRRRFTERTVPDPTGLQDGEATGEQGPVSTGGSESPSYVLFGDSRTFRNNDDLITALFTQWADDNQSFCEELAPRVNGSAPILSRRLEGFAPRSRKRARELPGGWYMNVVGNAGHHSSRIRKACEVVGVEYGRDLTVNLRGKRGKFG